ncbi:hypothetical protein BH24ACT5_BH24ACT5_11110 [soil metagenome]
MVLCLSCGWRDERTFDFDDEEREPPAAPEGDCTPSSDIKTMMRLDDVRRQGS